MLLNYKTAIQDLKSVEPVVRKLLDTTEDLLYPQVGFTEEFFPIGLDKNEAALALVRAITRYVRRRLVFLEYDVKIVVRSREWVTLPVH